jgi:hypothetical protein
MTRVDPEFKPQYCQKKKKKVKLNEMETRMVVIRNWGQEGEEESAVRQEKYCHYS